MTTSQIRPAALGLAGMGEGVSPAKRVRLKPILIGGLVLAVIGAGSVALVRPLGGPGAAGRDGAMLTYTVAPMALRRTVLESGTLESSSSVNVLCGVEGRVAIIDLVPEGTRVEAGDVVVELDSSALKTRRQEQLIVVERARNSRNQAQQAKTVAQSQAESNISSAELAVEFAELDLRKYLEGDYPQELRLVQSDITLAESELKRSKVQLEYSRELARDGYISEGELEIDESTVTRAQIVLDLAQVKEQLLKEYTHARTRREKESNVQEARRALERVRTQEAAALEKAASNLQAEESTLRLEEEKLRHIEDQIEKCMMRAPQAGVVVYPIPEDDDLVELYIKQGNMVRERQHVFSIPDTSDLRITTSIHEAMVNEVHPGMPARIWIDVYPDLELAGEVARVSPLPEPEDWRRATVKFYETKVRLLEMVPGLRPGMSAKVEILIESLPAVHAVPVQAVVQRGDAGLCYVLDGRSADLRRLVLGKANESFIEVREGLAEGERVVLSLDAVGISPAQEQELERSGGTTALAAQKTAVAPAGPGDASAPAPAAPVEVEFKATLVGSIAAVVDVELKITTAGGEEVERKFEVEVAGGPPGETWEVTVDGVVIGSVTLDALGAVQVKWKTTKGNWPENFPEGAGPGSTVTVGGVLSGTLQP